jgi:hypothetical protein
MAKNSDTSLEEAKLLISGVNKALASGTKHYNRTGKLLTSTEEVLKTLIEEGSVEMSG